ncbi:MAG TPA: cohesin domain-containing protein [Patescibacteria group bacterium]|nr:cohesin domain-containing protein [Patescibacteria group bacterium]
MIKKLILLGFGLTLLIGLPLAIFVLQNQSQTTTSSGAAPVTKFTFEGPTSVTNGQNFDENISVDPAGQNQVSFVKFTFTYDSSKLDKQATPITIDTTKYTVLDQPDISCAGNICTVTRTISVGSNQNAIIKTKTPIATIHFVAKSTTDANGTQLAFVAGQNQALSTGSADQAAENVFQTGVPATIVINDATTNGTGTDITPTESPTPTGTSTGTTGGSSGGSSGESAGSLSVSCTSFTADKTSGNPPLVVTFTTVGSSTTDSISQIDFNYGDGSTDIVASGSGIGTGDINNQISHTYSGNGAFHAYAVLTTAGGATSDSTTCTQTITVGAVAQVSASPTGLPPTGPGETFVLIGIAGAVLTAVGLVVIAGL